MVAALGAVLAFAAWRDTAVEYWLYNDPEAAPALLRSDPRVALAISDVAVLSPGEEDEGFWRAAPAIARSVLRTSPLDVIAVRQLALADGALGQPSFVPRLKTAERLSRRDTATQMALLQESAEANDYAETFRRLDMILTVEPPIGEMFFAPMATLLDEPAAREALSRYGRRPWFSAFAGEAVDKVTRPADLATLLMESRALPPAREDTLLSRLAGKLIDEGDFARARDLAIRFGRARPKILDEFALSETSTDPRFAPLTWRLNSSGPVQAGFSTEGGLDVAMQPGYSGLVAEKATSLRPGTYAIEHEVSREEDGDGGLTLAWDLRCGSTAGPVRRETWTPRTQPSHVRWLVEVPADCRIQRWRLTAIADDAQTEARFRVAALRIRQVS